uniref:7TM_GPCR_Srx domain-containing protein n=1 Tax=Bursaphelenchus xylophilus TaxID=6326 RepID=A0A1I7RPA4_BURXY
MYSKLIILSSMCNIGISVSRILVGFKATFIHDHLVYFTLSPIFYSASNHVQEIAIVLSFVFSFTQSMIPAIQFFYRYRIMKESFVSQRTLWFAFGVLFSYNFIDAITFIIIFEDNPQRFEKMVFSNIDAGCGEIGRPTFTVIVSAKPLSFWHNAMSNLGMLGSFVGVLYYGLKTWILYNQSAANIMHRRRRLNRQLTYMLILQTAPPMLFTVVPVLMFNSHLFSNQILEYTTLALALGPTFTPLFDAFTVIFILPSFRRRFFGLLRCKVPTLSTISVVSTSAKQGKPGR